MASSVMVAYWITVVAALSVAYREAACAPEDYDCMPWEGLYKFLVGGD